MTMIQGSEMQASELQAPKLCDLHGLSRVIR